jgi:stress-induced morphogen
MAISQNDLRSLIVESFPNAQIEIIDLAGDDNHYSVKIIDPIFAGKNRIEQHKLVNNALKGCLGDVLHAMQLKTLAYQSHS